MAFDLVNNTAINPDVFILPDQSRPVLQFSLVSSYTSRLKNDCFSSVKEFAETTNVHIRKCNPTNNSVCYQIPNTDHSSLCMYLQKPGSEIALYGTVQCQSDLPKYCFASTFQKGEAQTVDYFTCKTCSINCKYSNEMPLKELS